MRPGMREQLPIDPWQFGECKVKNFLLTTKSDQ